MPTITKQILRTNFKNNFSSLLGACRNMITHMTNDVTTLNLKLLLRHKYPNIEITQDMISKACEQLFNEGLFISFSDNGTYKTYQKDIIVGKATARTVDFKNINAAIIAYPELESMLGDYLHKSETRDQFELLKDMNIVHLRNKAKLVIQDWNTKGSLVEYLKCNKYHQELSRRENCI